MKFKTQLPKTTNVFHNYAYQSNQLIPQVNNAAS